MPIDTWKCERDWQGPSDDACEDDLLTVACVRRGPPHKGPHAVHVGVVEDDPCGGLPFRVVYWTSGTDRLHDLRTGLPYRDQFDTEDGKAPHGGQTCTYHETCPMPEVCVEGCAGPEGAEASP